jgi:transcriptional regulator with XRE-family HTH domain
MNIDQMTALARVNDMGLAAVAIRLRAARTVSGLQQKELAEAVGHGKSAVNNAEMGLTYPSREVMKFLYRAHRIDFNFILNGDFAQLPGDVQLAPFAALASATSEWDQKERSNRGPAKPKAVQPKG